MTDGPRTRRSRARPLPDIKEVGIESRGNISAREREEARIMREEQKKIDSILKDTFLKKPFPQVVITEEDAEAMMGGEKGTQGSVRERVGVFGNPKNTLNDLPEPTQEHAKDAAVYADHYNQGLRPFNNFIEQGTRAHQNLEDMQRELSRQALTRRGVPLRMEREYRLAFHALARKVSQAIMVASNNSMHPAEDKAKVIANILADGLNDAYGELR